MLLIFDGANLDKLECANKFKEHPSSMDVHAVQAIPTNNQDTMQQLIKQMATLTTQVKKLTKQIHERSLLLDDLEALIVASAHGFAPQQLSVERDHYHMYKYLPKLHLDTFESRLLMMVSLNGIDRSTLLSLEVPIHLHLI